MKKFRDKLTEDDQIAVLCILSHGVERGVYGCDGELVPVAELIPELDNDGCPKMRGKPKIIIIQACQGGNTYIQIITFII